ncbi:MAG TPA: tetratricopeptide repeat protein [Pyrinomonadaceae bacterium]|jgi:tetratricopeptide (TPR) repeat protein
MIDWLRPLLLMFYAPARGMSEVRERAPLAQSALLAWLAQSVYTAYTWWPVLSERGGVNSAFNLFQVLIQSGRLVLFTAIAFVPVLIFVANIFERRGSFGLTLQQEYAATASAIFYARTAACIAALPLLMLARSSGFEQNALAQSEELLRDFAQAQNIPADVLASELNPLKLLENVALSMLLPFFVLWIVIALREVFRLSWVRAVGVVVASGIIMVPVSAVLWPLFNWLFASPFLLLFLFILLRGYFVDFSRAQRARASFKRNLEAATLNPADASAHYNLGLVHLQRKELDEARKRFERAIEIDAEEVDSHFQLGRIARAEGRLPDAIKHYEQVVVRDASHAQHEIWREIGATYASAGQFADALDAIERFLNQRSLDPEGLYLKGRALAGVGRRREANDAMQACIEAVKTAPAYKYRTEKRWLNEAQQFLRSQA